MPRWARDCIIVFVLTRLLVAAPLYVWWFGPFPHTELGPNEPIWHGDTAAYPAWIEPFRRWDALWFINLARDGYEYNPNAQSNTSVFPLYPALMRAGGGGAGFAIAGLAVSNLALLAACLLIFKLLEPRVGAAGALRGLTALLVFPTAFVFSGVYAESLMMALCAGAMLCAERRRWFAAGALAALAALTRLPGVIVAAPLAVIAFEEWRGAGKFPRGAAWILLAPAALAAYFQALSAETGSFFGYFITQAHWGKQFANPLAGLAFNLTSVFSFANALDVACALGFLLLGYVVMRKYTAAGGVYVLAGTLLAMSQSSLFGLPRYVAVLFPAMLAPAALGAHQPWLYRAWIVVSAALMIYCHIQFANWKMSF